MPRKAALKGPRQKLETRRLESWSEFLSEVAMSPDLKTWTFRGQKEAGWPLFSSLSTYLREFKVDPRVWRCQESRILRIFRSKAHLFLDHVPPPEDSFQWLALLQHHGAPTRLLDLTWSPYVAAFFALERASCDCAVWALNTPQIVPYQHTVSIAGIGELEPGKMTPRNEGNFEQYFLPGNLPFVAIDTPKVSNKRLTAQSGTFLIPGQLDLPVEKILAGYQTSEPVVKKFVLAESVRDEGMRELYKMNLTNATLFPDLDGLGRSMAYEFEFHWAFDPRTAHEYPGYESYLKV